MSWYGSIIYWAWGPFVYHKYHCCLDDKVHREFKIAFSTKRGRTILFSIGGNCECRGPK